MEIETIKVQAQSRRLRAEYTIDFGPPENVPTIKIKGGVLYIRSSTGMSMFMPGLWNEETLRGGSVRVIEERFGREIGYCYDQASKKTGVMLVPIDEV